jgi:4'-phosphopantetheinyl transferase
MVPEPVSVHVWLRSITEMQSQREALLAAITGDERDRMSRFLRDADRMRFLVGRATLRQEVARWRGIEPLDVPLCFGPQGKPMIAGGPHANVTHSGDLVGIALCAGAPLGIDIEQTVTRLEREELAAFFSPAEIRGHLALPDDVRDVSFFHIWTTKEALLKAAATGLSLSLQSFDVAVDPAQLPSLLEARCEELSGDVCVARLDVPAGYAAAIAVLAPSCEIVYRR